MEGTDSIVQMWHVKAHSLTAEEGVYRLQMCTVTTSVTCKEKHTSLVLCMVIADRLFLMVTGFLEGRFLSMND